MRSTRRQLQERGCHSRRGHGRTYRLPPCRRCHGREHPGHRGEPTQPCEREPAPSTALAEESFIDFEDAQETVSHAPSEPPSGTQHADAGTVEEPSADPQATEEPEIAYHEEAGGVAPLEVIIVY